MSILSIEGGQGSSAWLARRAERLPNGLPARWNASDAPAMMGCEGAHETRSQLLARLHSGIEREFSDYQTERVIEPGHEFERRARALAELLLDDDLAPVLVEEGRISASLDGRTLSGIGFEHKRLNAALRELLPDLGTDIAGPDVGRALPLMYRVQIAHQHLADPECQRTLFGATEWDGDRLLGQRWCWVERDEALCAQVLAGWVQFEKDLLAYVPAEPAPQVVAAPQEHLPAVSIQVRGSLAVASNLAELAPRLRAYIERIPKNPSTDQEFADVEAAGKRLREAQAAIEGAVRGALASIADVNELQSLGGELAEAARVAAIACEKAAASGKDAVKQREMAQRFSALVEHVKAANMRVGAFIPAPTSTGFHAVVKGLKTLESYRDKLDTELARAKIECDTLEAKIAGNLATIAAAGTDLEGLFRDRSQLVLKDPETVGLIVAQRVAEHKAAEERRLEAERARIRAEEEARAARAAQDSQRQASEGASTLARQTAVAPSAGAQAEGAAVVSAAAAPGRVRLADICTKLGWKLTAAEVEAMGVTTEREKVTVLVAAADIPRLKAAMHARIESL